MKRITVEEVVQAFEETGLKPAIGEYFQTDINSNNCACGLGAVFLAITPEEEINALKKEYGDLTGVTSHYFDERYGMNYRLGFVHGFDGGKPQSILYNESTEYKLGYDDGKAANEKLNPVEVI